MLLSFPSRKFETPEAYAKLDNAITRRFGLPDKRTRYHNPYIKAKDIISNGVKITIKKGSKEENETDT